MVLSDLFWQRVVRTKIDPVDVSLMLRIPVEVVRSEMERVTGRMPSSGFAWEEACRQLRSTWRS